MKRLFYAFALLTVLAGCSKENMPEATPPSSSTDKPAKQEYVFNFDIACESETRSIKQEFANGDKVYVFFDGIGSGMLTLEYSDGKWSATSNSALSATELSELSSKNIVAAWVDGNGTPTLENGAFSFADGERLASERISYTVKGNEVTASVNLKHEANSIKVSVDMENFQEDENPWLLPGGGSSFSIVANSNGDWSVVSASTGDDSKGIAYDDGENKGVYFMVTPDALDLGHVTIVHGDDQFSRSYEGKDAAEYAGKAIKMTGPVYGSAENSNGWTHQESNTDDGNYVIFSDAEFKAYMIENFDTDGDGKISIAEAEAVTEITCPRTSLSLSGIEYCVNLTYLDCNFCNLTSLDISKNTALEILNCWRNQLMSLDVSNNLSLTHLSIAGNQLTSLDVSNNAALVYLYCDDNKLTSLDVSNNYALEYLHCNNIQLDYINVSNNISLTHLFCAGCGLSSLDVSNNQSLDELDCSNNQLTSLDVSNNTALRFLYCDGNQLTALDISNNAGLLSLKCADNQLAFLDVSNNLALVELDCLDNQDLATLYIAPEQVIETLEKEEHTEIITKKDASITLSITRGEEVVL